MRVQGELNALRLMRSAYESGIRNVWFNSGSDLVPLQEAIRVGTESGSNVPTLRQCVHEHVALSAAMGECMATGRPSMTVAHADLGLLNYGGAIHNASAGGYPVVILTGYPPTTPSERTSKVYWLQQIADQGAVIRQYVKWDYKLTPYDDPAFILSRAVQIAMTPPRGPVYISAPLEVTSGRWDGDGAELQSACNLGLVAHGSGKSDLLEDLAARLLRARSPLVVTDRLGNDPAAVGVLSDLASEFGIAVHATRHRMNFPDDHPSSGAISIEDADVILVVESAVPWIPALKTPNPDSFVAVASADPVFRRVPLVEFRADLRLVCDPREMLADLVECMRALADSDTAAHARRRSRLFRIKRDQDEAAWRVDAKRALDSPVPSESSLQAALANVMCAEDVLCWEIVQNDRISRIAPQTLFEKGGSSLGWAPAAAIGYTMAKPGPRVIALCGDGGYYFSDPLACVWMQLEHRAPVVTVIANNRGYRTGTTAFVKRYPRTVVNDRDLVGGQVSGVVDLTTITQANGGFGRSVHSNNDLVPTLQDALAAAADGKPAVVDVWLPEHVTGNHPLK